MASCNIYDPHGLHDFLSNATRATSIFDDDVVDVLANLFIQTPRYRNLRKTVCDTAHGVNIVQRCKQEALNDNGTLICTPILAVELIVDLRMPRTRYPILQEFIGDFRHKFTPKLRVQWSPRLPGDDDISLVAVKKIDCEKTYEEAEARRVQYKADAKV